MTTASTLCAAVAAGALALLTGPAFAAAPAAEPVTPQLIEAATKEGKVVFYSAIDLKVTEGLAKVFEQKYPGITVQVERTGSERIYQRLAQERANKIFAVDVLDGSDQALFVTWKKEGVLEPYIPVELLKWPAAQRDADGTFASIRFTLMPIAYNTNLVKPEDAPKSFADLLDPKWSGKIVKAHPSYSGGIVTSTFQTVKAMGWDYIEKLGKQKVLQVQSATEPPKKLALGERAISADGLEYMDIRMQLTGAPIKIVYPKEGTPFIPGCEAIANNAPHPNAARLFMSFMVSRETQQYLADEAGLRSFHPDVKLKPGVVPTSQIKLLPSDPVAQAATTEEIKKKYAQYFGI
ncbi:MAG TPA: extracellular solute-binding protein [Pseudolabrys sp.]|nr:extracellular solute-binding protein [Pseudolabrys sp.]